MQVRIEELSPVEKKLAVEVEWPAVLARLDVAYRQLGRDVTLPGFRKGKVPRNVLERMFSRQVEQDVSQQLVQETFFRAVKDHSLEPVAEPVVERVEFDRGAGFRYSARVEVRAPVEPHDYDAVELERGQPEVTVEEVEAALERKREELAEYRKVEGRLELAATDVAIVDLKGEVQGRPFQREAVRVDLTRPAESPIHGLAEALIGVSLTAKDHPVTLPAPEKTGAGESPSTPRLAVTVHEAREKALPTLDDDFAKDTGEADTLADLRAKLREQILQAKDKDIERQLRQELLKEIVRKNPFQVAPSLVERRSESMVERARYSLALDGIDLRKTAVDENRLKDQMRPAAEEEVRAQFLLEAIADKEKVELSDADLEKRLAEMARARQTSVARLKAELQKEERIEFLRRQLREEKTLDLLLSRANIKFSSEAKSPSEK